MRLLIHRHEIQLIIIQNIWPSNNFHQEGTMQNEAVAIKEVTNVKLWLLSNSLITD